jgi:hypothetical protein
MDDARVQKHRRDQALVRACKNIDKKQLSTSEGFQSAD